MFSLSNSPLAPLLLAGTCCLGLTGCGRGVPVCIDNADSVAIAVSINGAPPVTVEAGTRHVVHCQPGESVFVVRRNGHLSHIETHTIEDQAASGMDSAYLLNPDRSRRYVVAEVNYGHQEEASVVRLALASPELSNTQKRQVLYKQIAQQVRLLPLTGWHNISDTDNRFQELPTTLLAASTGSSLRTLQTVTTEQYMGLTAATGKPYPTAADCHQLQLAATDIMQHF